MEAAAKVRETSLWQKISGIMLVIFVQKELKDCSAGRDTNHPWGEKGEITFFLYYLRGWSKQSCRTGLQRPSKQTFLW